MLQQFEAAKDQHALSKRGPLSTGNPVLCEARSFMVASQIFTRSQVCCETATHSMCSPDAASHLGSASIELTDVRPLARAAPRLILRLRIRFGACGPVIS